MSSFDAIASKLVDFNQESFWSMRNLTYPPITHEDEHRHEHMNAPTDMML